MTIQYTSQQDANLSQNDLLTLWNEDPSQNEYRLTSDYISKGINFSFLFENDVNLQGQIESSEDRISQNEEDIATNAQNIALNADLIATNTSDISANSSSIQANTDSILDNSADIATNASDIAGISTPSGSGSPEGLVTSTRTQFYVDTSGSQLYYNPTIGADTGWVAL